MAKTFTDLSSKAEKYGLKLRVSLSEDLETESFRFEKGCDDDFATIREAARWLDGYACGVQAERTRAEREEHLSDR